MTHQKKQCFQCNYEKTCGGANSHQRQDTNCDTMPLVEYEKFVASETKHVQAKVTAAIDKAMETIANKQSRLMENIKFDPRQRAAERMTLQLDLKISYSG